jgi:hypothetical protein
MAESKPISQMTSEELFSEIKEKMWKLRNFKANNPQGNHQCKNKQQRYSIIKSYEGRIRSLEEELDNRKTGRSLEPSKIDIISSLADQYIKLATGGSAYWIRPDGTFIHGNYHLPLAIKEFQDLGQIKEDYSEEEIYNYLFAEGYSRIQNFMDTQLVIQATIKPDNLHGNLVNFILENHLDYIPSVMFGIGANVKECSMDEFLNN